MVVVAVEEERGGGGRVGGWGGVTDSEPHCLAPPTQATCKTEKTKNKKPPSPQFVLRGTDSFRVATH